jgi:hypothetical protein
MNKITIINEDTEHQRAAYWRRRIMLLRPEQLSALIGYSSRQIYQLETGMAQDGKHTTPPEVWRRYKLACAGLHAQTRGWAAGKRFEWRL